MNFVKKTLAKKGIRSRVGALEEIKALLLPALNLSSRFWVFASSSCSVRLNGKLTQGLRQVMQDPGAIAIKNMNIVFLN